MKKIILLSLSIMAFSVIGATNRVQGVSFNTSNLVFSPPEVQVWNTNRTSRIVALESKVSVLQTNTVTVATASSFIKIDSVLTNALGYVTNLVFVTNGGVTNSFLFYVAP